MLQQIIRAISKSILGRFSESNNQIWADLKDKERRIVENRLDTNTLQGQAISFQQNAENLVRDLESHKKQIWADVLDKERRIVSNTLKLDQLENDTNQKVDAVRELVYDLGGTFKQSFGDLSNRHFDLENKVNDRFDALTGIIDDTNLDSIREIADRIKAEAEGNQTLRSEVKQADAAINQKIDSLIPVELQGKSQEEWERMIEEIVSQEMDKLSRLS